MELLVNACVIVTTILAFGYLCYAMIRPERF
jgi:K+-transporting ATPase KdpF subunit